MVFDLNERDFLEEGWVCSLYSEGHHEHEHLRLTCGLFYLSYSYSVFFFLSYISIHHISPTLCSHEVGKRLWSGHNDIYVDTWFFLAIDNIKF